MKIQLRKTGFSKAGNDLLVCFVGPKKKSPFGVEDAGVSRELAAALRKSRFRSDRWDQLAWNVGVGRTARRYLMLGLGAGRRTWADSVRIGAARAIREAARLRAGTIAVALPDGDDDGEILRAAMEGLGRGGYEFDRHLTDDDRKPNRVASVDIYCQGRRTSAEVVRRSRAHNDAVDLARDLVNEGPSRLTPQILARAAQKRSRESGLRCKVLGHAELKRLGMKALLEVTRGAKEPPRVVHMTYRPAKKTQGAKKLVLVGKGVTFDSGGLNLKPTEYMATMKSDMGGAAAVIAAMGALKAIGCKHEVHGLVGLVENLTGSNAYMPGDILDTYLGKTVEVGNTDAEGRLVLCDLLAYAAKTLRPDAMVDLATLTGAVVVALGPDASGLFTDDGDLREQLLEAADASGEKLWQLPLYRDYLQLLQHGPADLNNVGGRWGGAITAALFLREFVPRDLPWAHIDIAGPAFAERSAPDRAIGGSGAAVPTLIRWLESR
ncbi:MAG: leucyl aminopeptidase [Acidobacteriota bacterium]|nr:leucyl aminopeptidase [Acidobacteriota bacterium]MDH3786038.1 leucyl aminopeptidase [Acidobacteriota bacterium]